MTPNFSSRSIVVSLSWHELWSPCESCPLSFENLHQSRRFLQPSWLACFYAWQSCFPKWNSDLETSISRKAVIALKQRALIMGKSSRSKIRWRLSTHSFANGKPPTPYDMRNVVACVAGTTRPESTLRTCFNSIFRSLFCFLTFIDRAKARSLTKVQKKFAQWHFDLENVSKENNAGYFKRLCITHLGDGKYQIPGETLEVLKTL